MSEEAEAHSSATEDDEEEGEEEESHSPLGGRRKKRTTSIRLEAEASKKGTASLPDNSTADSDISSEWRPRNKPLAES